MQSSHAIVRQFVYIVTMSNDLTFADQLDVLTFGAGFNQLAKFQLSMARAVRRPLKSKPLAISAFVITCTGSVFDVKMLQGKSAV
jgi:hypothetical protein